MEIDGDLKLMLWAEACLCGFPGNPSGICATIALDELVRQQRPDVWEELHAAAREGIEKLRAAYSAEEIAKSCDRQIERYDSARRDVMAQLFEQKGK